MIEKPMATTAAACAALLDAAEASGATLAVGHVRRFMPANQWVQPALAEGRLSSLQTVDVREGAIFGWPAVSDFFWRRETAKGGVLADTGAHVLDLLPWCLGRPETLRYQDDAMGGVEADALATWRVPGHVTVTCELSRTRGCATVILRRAMRARSRSAATPATHRVADDAAGRGVRRATGRTPAEA
ncbi:MAG: hypothetical protein M5U09_02805 [Gammaproteobacteria bacterium]|nr:hypothetical protein [Gammaproteobacteria bacterium]